MPCFARARTLIHTFLEMKLALLLAGIVRCDGEQALDVAQQRLQTVLLGPRLLLAGGPHAPAARARLLELLHGALCR